jgi:hypothetical protein
VHASQELQGHGAAMSKATVKSGTKTKPVHPPVDRFPFAQYASALCVRLILVGFTALYLPQTARIFAPLGPRRPEDGQTSVRIHGGVDCRPIFDAGLDIRGAYCLGSVVGELDVEVV